MKHLLIFLFLSNIFLYAEEAKEKDLIIIDEPTEAEIKLLQQQNAKRKQVTSLIMEFIEKEYANKAKELIPKLEKRLKSLKDKHNRSTNKSYKEKAKKAIAEVDADLQIQKMWVLYHKYFVLRITSRDNKDFKRYESASKVLKQIKEKYKELKAEEFPAPENEFFRKNSEKVQKFLGEK